MSVIEERRTAAEVTRQSKSNLAFTLACLSEERRKDMVTFYAYCRVVDDIADSMEIPRAEKVIGLQHWREIVTAEKAPTQVIEREVLDLMKKYTLDPDLMTEIIEGMSMDLDVVRYETFEDLKKYCYRVASVVGLVSVEIFGYKNPQSRDYMADLGYALQMTNIMRDVGEDMQNEGRVYLPQEDLREFGVTEEDLKEQRYGDAFVALMQKQDARAEGFFKSCREKLPPEDRVNMRAGDMMWHVYRNILHKMRAGRYRVFETRYRASKPKMLALLAGGYLKGLFGR